MRPNTASIAEMVSAAVFPVSRAASVTRDLRSCKTSTGRVHLQMMRSPSMAGLAAAFNGLRTIMDRGSILDGVARGSGATRATPFVATCQITPPGLGLLSGPIDEGVDC